MSRAISPDPVEWNVEPAPVAYLDAVGRMERRVARIAAGTAPETVWLLEHPECYTAGTSAKVSDLLAPGSLPVYASGRGGQYTYHGPGQRIAYLMLDVRRRFGGDVRAFVAATEGWLIDSLAALGVAGETRKGRVGVWVATPDGEAKVAAVGLRIRNGISLHGVSVNVEPDLSRYGGIVPCGIGDKDVTSLRALGAGAPMRTVDAALRASFERRLGARRDMDARAAAAS